MFTINLTSLESLNPHELAALYAAVRNHTKLDVVTSILEAGYANCGESEFNALILEAQLAHIGA